MGDAAGISAGANAAGGVAGAYSEYQSGRFNAKVDLYNAKVATLQAADAVRRGEEAVVRNQIKTRVLKGAQRAALAAQGVVLDDGGSSTDILTDTDVQAAKDEQTIRVNAALEAWGFQVQAVDNRARARMERYSANNRAAGTLLDTAGRFNDRAYKAGLYDSKPPAGYSNSEVPSYRLQGPANPFGTANHDLPVY